jgi:class 3 adenylate cyclase
MNTLPGGTVTFLFSDIEGSTRLLERLGDRYEEVNREHGRLLREQLEAAGGREIDKHGDAFFFSFPRAKDAVRGAVGAQRALTAHAWPEDIEVKVRMGLHTGEPTIGEEGYVGMDVVRAARICSAGHGGQILLSETTRALLGNDLPDGSAIRDLGEAHLKDVQHERIFELALSERGQRFPPLNTVAPETAADSLAREIEDRVYEDIRASLGRRPSKSTTKVARLAVIGWVNLVLVVLAGIAIFLLVRALL